MDFYRAKAKPLSGTSFAEVLKNAKTVFRKIAAHTKRTPYIRSAYFKKQKIFLTIFWAHVLEKSSYPDRIRRLRFYECGVELLRQSVKSPTTKQDPNRADQVLHRFGGITAEGKRFYVQVKEDKRSGRKDLISIFPAQ